MKSVMTLLLIVSLAVLAGCKDTQDVSVQNYSGMDLYYTYPMNGQADVSPNAPVVLAYLGAVSAQASDFALTGVKQDGTAFAQAALPHVQINSSPIDGGKSVVLSFVDSSNKPVKLATGATYTLMSGNSALSLPTGGLVFTVRPDYNGPVSQNQSKAAFEVATLSPDGTDLPFLDFSTLDLTFTHPLDVQSAVYGTTVKLEQGGNLVPATLLVNGRKMTLDPTNATGDDSSNHDLTPGVPVTLTLDGLKDEDGNTLAAYTRTFTPQDTTPRATMVQTAPAAAASGDCNDSNATLSSLTGMAINCVPVIAKLLGDTTNSSQQGDVFAQLAFGPHFPEVTPLRIKKGALLKGGALAVNIGGHVPAGFDSGDVTVTFLSDANGYLLPNPYTSDPNAPKRLIMTADMAFDTKDPRANGAFTQNLLHVTLIGAAIADPKTGVLKADAVGIVEPSVLGLEHAYGILSFHMESYPDQTQVPAQQQDDRPLELSSWVPGVVGRDPTQPAEPGTADNIADTLRPGDPIVLSFNKPLDRNSVLGGGASAAANESLSLTLNGARLPFTWTLNGTALVIHPDGGLKYSTVAQASTYQISYTDGLKDLQGTSPTGQTLVFTMPVFADTTGHSPIITAAYPGFPCVTTGLDLANATQGRCAGGLSSDDLLPIPPMPANRSIHLNFSQVIGNAELGANIKVEKCESATSCNAPTEVAGRLVSEGRNLTFTPQDKWEKDALYRYTLVSGSRASDASICVNKGALCSAVDAGFATEPHPLKTALLQAPDYDAGGPNLVVYFKGAPVTDNVLQALQQLPVADVNADFNWQAGEPSPGLAAGETPDPRVLLNSTKLAVKSTGGAITAGEVGCDPGDDCPDNKYIYMTGALDADIVGFKTATQVQQMATDNANISSYIPADASANGGVLAYIYPTQIVATSITTVATTALSIFTGNTELPTGTQIMRIRYQQDASGKPTQPVLGWIVEDSGKPVFKTILDVYMDAPYLNITQPVAMDHKMHSYPLKVVLSGPVNFLPDGRLQIGQTSQTAMTIDAVDTTVLGFIPAKLSLEVPLGGINLNYVGAPIEN